MLSFKKLNFENYSFLGQNFFSIYFFSFFEKNILFQKYSCVYNTDQLVSIFPTIAVSYTVNNDVIRSIESWRSSGSASSVDLQNNPKYGDTLLAGNPDWKRQYSKLVRRCSGVTCNIHGSNKVDSFDRWNFGEKCLANNQESWENFIAEEFSYLWAFSKHCKTWSLISRGLQTTQPTSIWFQRKIFNSWYTLWHKNIGQILIMKTSLRQHS